MNTLDIGVLVVLAIFAYIGYRNGLMHTVFRLGSYFIALILAVSLYPAVSRFIRESFIYDTIRGWIAQSVGFRDAFGQYAQSYHMDETVRGNNIISALPVPQALRDSLLDYNTPDMFELLRVNTVEDFVSSFFAGIIINILSMLLVFVLVLVILRVISKALGIVDKLPLIRSVNRAGGLVAGVLIGAILAWLGLTLVTVFFTASQDTALYGLIQGSAILRWLLDAGWLLVTVA